LDFITQPLPFCFRSMIAKINATKITNCQKLIGDFGHIIPLFLV
jgi:hypothetical protein